MTYYYCNNVVGNLGLLSFISACGIVPSIIANLFIPSLAQNSEEEIFFDYRSSRKCLWLSALTDCSAMCWCWFILARLIKGFSVGFLLPADLQWLPTSWTMENGKPVSVPKGLINSCAGFWPESRPRLHPPLQPGLWQWAVMTERLQRRVHRQ